MAEIDRLKDIVETLRGENGCPWDRAQTHTSLKPEVIEEAKQLIEQAKECLLHNINTKSCRENSRKLHEEFPYYCTCCLVLP